MQCRNFPTLNDRQTDIETQDDDYFALFKAAFLGRTTRHVASVPCPHDCGHAHDVRPRRDGSFVGVCQGEEDEAACGDIPLTADDVAAWELNWGLGRAVAGGFRVRRKDRRDSIGQDNPYNSRFRRSAAGML